VKHVDRIHVIACGVLALDIKKTAEDLGIRIAADFLEGGLHAKPGELRRRLQAAIDRASAEGKCDRIVVGYGVCGRGSVGIHARGVPLAIPRVHDCISLFLGSDAAYRSEFARFPGTYYISAGWFEEKVRPKLAGQETADGKRKDPEYDRLAAKYGEESARAIVEFTRSWQRNYQRAAFIDTGAGDRDRYAAHARAMAAEFGWRYEALLGDLSLLQKALTAPRTTPDVLLVPPRHVTTFDPVEGVMKAVPEWAKVKTESRRTVSAGADRETAVRAGLAPPGSGRAGQHARLGLGIDAGGTYTDAVIYDFAADSVLATGKALTTKWDYTVGIENALAELDAGLLPEVDLVSVSTTLATNAIVEGHGQKVGLLVMAPGKVCRLSDISNEPKALISGRMRIDGTEISPPDPEEVRRIARDMVDRHGVGAFAVSGYGGIINPSHELQVKAAVREETGLGVTCGHELSEMLDFLVRADTAVLNARIIPRLERFLSDVEHSLRVRGIHAPVMVVKGDGSLVSADTARERPVETVLSGPAASVAGARHLTHCPTALAVDMGGTTSDTAAIKDGVVRTCPAGARVGPWKTHVKALDMRTTGLGGDSLITCERRSLHIGPLRVGPMAWLAAERPEVTRALDYVESRLDDYATSTRAMEMLTLTARANGYTPGPEERAILDVLRERPCSLAEVHARIGSTHWSLLRLEGLEENYVVQRCGLTPTDLLHALGRVKLWDARAARRLCEMVSHVAGYETKDFIELVIEQVVRKLAIELLKKQLDEETEPDAMDACPVCQTLIGNLFSEDSSEYAVNIQLARPVIGLGAPVRYFLPRAAELLKTEAIIPPHAEVANAIGAVTSCVVVDRQVHIRPSDTGGFAVHGLPRARRFKNLDEAHRHARGELERLVRDLARAAGTSEDRVDMRVHDHISSAADGTEVFLERTLHARVSGPPNAARTARRR